MGWTYIMTDEQLTGLLGSYVAGVYPNMPPADFATYLRGKTGTTHSHDPIETSRTKYQTQYGAQNDFVTRWQNFVQNGDLALWWAPGQFPNWPGPGVWDDDTKDAVALAIEALPRAAFEVKARIEQLAYGWLATGDVVGAQTVNSYFGAWIRWVHTKMYWDGSQMHDQWPPGDEKELLLGAIRLYMHHFFQIMRFAGDFGEDELLSCAKVTFASRDIPGDVFSSNRGVLAGLGNCLGYVYWPEFDRAHPGTSNSWGSPTDDIGVFTGYHSAGGGHGDCSSSYHQWNLEHGWLAAAALSANGETTSQEFLEFMGRLRVSALHNSRHYLGDWPPVLGAGPAWVGHGADALAAWDQNGVAKYWNGELQTGTFFTLGYLYHRGQWCTDAFNEVVPIAPEPLGQFTTGDGSDEEEFDKGCVSLKSEKTRVLFTPGYHAATADKFQDHLLGLQIARFGQGGWQLVVLDLGGANEGEPRKADWHSVPWCPSEYSYSQALYDPAHGNTDHGTAWHDLGEKGDGAEGWFRYQVEACALLKRQVGVLKQSELIGVVDHFYEVDGKECCANWMFAENFHAQTQGGHYIWTAINPSEPGPGGSGENIGITYGQDGTLEISSPTGNMQNWWGDSGEAVRVRYLRAVSGNDNHFVCAIGQPGIGRLGQFQVANGAVAGFSLQSGDSLYVLGKTDGQSVQVDLSGIGGAGGVLVTNARMMMLALSPSGALVDGWADSGTTAATLDGDSILSDVLNEPVNEPPANPGISGPTTANLGETKTYTAATSDPEGDQWYIKWIVFRPGGMGSPTDWRGPFDNGDPGDSLEVEFNQAGTWRIQAQAKDIHGNPSGVTEMQVWVNRPPADPTIAGPTTADYGDTLTYWAGTNDPDGDQWRIGWRVIRPGGLVPPIQWSADWYENGQPGDSRDVVFDQAGTWKIQAQAKDTHGALSGVTEIQVEVAEPPSAPRKPETPENMDPLYWGTDCRFRTRSEIDGPYAGIHKIQFQWWVNGKVADWTQTLYDNNEDCIRTVFLTEPQVYYIKARARNASYPALVSDWSDTAYFEPMQPPG